MSVEQHLERIFTTALKSYQKCWPDPPYYFAMRDAFQRYLEKRYDTVPTHLDARMLASFNVYTESSDNTGLCYLLTVFVKCYLKDTLNISAEPVYLMNETRFHDVEPAIFLHAFIRFNGKYFDTCNPTGASAWEYLPFVNSEEFSPNGGLLQPWIVYTDPILGGKGFRPERDTVEGLFLDTLFQDLYAADTPTDAFQKEFWNPREPL